MVATSKNFVGIRYIFKEAIKKQHSAQELDSIFLVCGEEGSGKSNFLLMATQILEEEKGEQIQIDQVTRTLKELIVRLKYTKDKGFIGLDEGSELSSDRQFESIMKGLKKAFTIMRQKALIVLLSYPNPFKINTYFREDRAKGVFFITRRKYVHFFTRKDFQEIQREMKRYNAGVKSIGDFIDTYGRKASLVDTIPKYEGHLLKEYQKRKKENIQEILDELYEEFGVDEKLYSLSQACKYLEVNDDLLRRFLRYDEDTDDINRIIPVQWNLAHTKMKLKEKDLIDFKYWYKLNILKKTEQQAHTIDSGKKIPEAQEQILKQNDIIGDENV
jgi:energy-coupling factor transporter ATP-binding protein EcfA2